MNLWNIVWLLLLPVSIGTSSVSHQDNQTKELDLESLNEYILPLCFSIVRLLENILGISMESELLLTQKYWNSKDKLLKRPTNNAISSAKTDDFFPLPRLTYRLPDKLKVHPLTLFSLFYDFGFNSSRNATTNDADDYGFSSNPGKKVNSKVSIVPTVFSADVATSSFSAWPPNFPDDYQFDLIDTSAPEQHPSYGYRKRVRAVGDQMPGLNESFNYPIVAIDGLQILPNSSFLNSTSYTNDATSNSTAYSNVTAIDFTHMTNNQSTVITELAASTTTAANLFSNNDNVFSNVTELSKIKLNPHHKLHEAHLNHSKLKHQKLLDHIKRVKLINQQKLANHTAKHRQHSLKKGSNKSPSSLLATLRYIFRNLFNLLDRVLTTLIIRPGEAVERAIVRIFRNLYSDARLLYQMARTLLGMFESACRYKFVCQLSSFLSIHVPNWLKRQIPTSGEEYYVSVVEAASDHEVLNAALTGMMGFECSEIYQSLSCT